MASWDESVGSWALQTSVWSDRLEMFSGTVAYTVPSSYLFGADFDALIKVGYLGIIDGKIEGVVGFSGEFALEYGVWIEEAAIVNVWTKEVVA